MIEVPTLTMEDLPTLPPQINEAAGGSLSPFESPGPSKYKLKHANPNNHFLDFAIVSSMM